MKRLIPMMLLLAVGEGSGQTVVGLPELVVYSPRIANQAPAATFTMPVSALRFEPTVDVQARNMAEAQADITIRGSTFENTGFRLGAVTLLDPQTGHYLAEIPVAPLMLGAPSILTGAANALASTNVDVGSIDYAWRPIRPAGLVDVGFGQYRLDRQEVYLAGTRTLASGATLGADADYARSDSAGAVPYGDSHFQRVAGRLQWQGTGGAQTDLVAAYQHKFFGWPDLYTPYGVNETENLQTVLLALNHRVNFADGGWFEAGAYHRRNKDDYEFNRFIPGLYNPYQHTTWMTGAAVDGKQVFAAWALRFRAELGADKLNSTSLTAGNYHSRTIGKGALAGERRWAAGAGGDWDVLAGLTYDQTNHDGGALSPVAELTRHLAAGAAVQAIRLGYAETSQVPSYTALDSPAGSGLFRGNPDLGREYSRNLELAVSGAWAGWQAEATVFHRWDDHLVDWTFRTGVLARTANPVNVGTNGFQLVARRDFTWGGVTLGYTYLDKTADYGSATVNASFYALNYAHDRLTAAFTVKLSREWELRLDNEARVQATNALRTTGGDHALRSSLALLWHLQAWRGVEFSLQADNLWNSAFEDVPAVPAAGRQLVVSVAYGW